MATTAQQIFEMAMHLADENSQITGAVDTPDVADYKARTPALLNILRVEAFPYSSNYRPSRAGSRPYCPPVNNLSSVLQLDDGICQGILPYALAARLFLDDNPAFAAYCEEKYGELLREYQGRATASLEAIEDIYGGIEYGSGARW